MAARFLIVSSDDCGVEAVAEVVFFNFSVYGMEDNTDPTADEIQAWLIDSSKVKVYQIVKNN